MSEPAVKSEVLTVLASLADGWDGYGGAPITEAAMRVARAIHVVPTCNGGIQVEWHVNGWDLEVEVSKDGIPVSVVMERIASAGEG